MSDMTRCPHCREVIYIDDRYCPHCMLDVWGSRENKNSTRALTKP